MPKKLTTEEFVERAKLVHGNPKIFNPNDMNKSVEKTFGNLYNNTINKLNRLKSYGYGIVHIWESDWKEQNASK